MTFFVLRRLGTAFLGTTDGTLSGNSTGSGAALRPIDDLLASLMGRVNDLERLTSGKSRETLMQPDNDGGWGVVDILSHLLDWQLVTEERIQRLLNEYTPQLEEFDDSLWAVEHNYRDNDPFRVLEDLRKRREAMIETLEHLEPEAWERNGTLDRFGTITLHWLMNRMCDHDTKHLQQARDVLA
jgi:hypothetical protein